MVEHEVFASRLRDTRRIERKSRADDEFVIPTSSQGSTWTEGSIHRIREWESRADLGQFQEVEREYPHFHNIKRG